MTEFSFGTTSEPNTDYNRPIIGMMGQYTLAGGTNVPYISATLEIERVVKELRAFDQIPPSLSATWSLRELCQRDIDYDRIMDEIVNGYLKAGDKLKFFNALTFVFFPKSPDGGFQETFEGYEGNDPVIPHPEVEIDKQFATGAEKVVFGGVQLATKGLFARVRWDDNRVAAIAVDGQHRLTALRKWWESKQQALTSDERKTRIPVLFMLLHPAAGFVSPGGGKSLRQVARDIFTDLNKNARKVDEARELILDDRSLEAECVRRLVTNETCRDASDSLPLSLVRWQEANNRFDSKYYLNSLLNLHQVVKIAVPVKDLGSPLDPDKVRDYIRELCDCLVGSSHDLSADGQSLLSYYDERYVTNEDEGECKPFVHLPPRYLSEAAKSFAQMHQPYIVAATMQLKPYKELLHYCRSHNLITGEFSQYNAQPAAHKKQLEEKFDEDWLKRNVVVHEKALEAIKRCNEPNETWCFKAIFQKAVVRLFREIVFVHGSDPDKRARLGELGDVLVYLDELYDRGWLEIKKSLPSGGGPLWAGIGVRFNDAKIKVNKSVEEAIFSALLLGYFARRKHIFDTSLKRPHSRKASDLARYFSQQTSGDDVVSALWPRADEAHKKLMSSLMRESPAWKRMPEDKEKRRSLMESEARDRLAAILACIAFDYDFDA